LAGRRRKGREKEGRETVVKRKGAGMGGVYQGLEG